MSYTINFFGWCNEDGHDKVWGYVTVGDTHDRFSELYNFWGKRGKRLSFQQHEGGATWWNDEALQDRAAKKTRPRTNGQYHRIPVDQIDEIVPGFHEEFEKQLTLAKLFDRFYGRRPEGEDA